MPKFYNTETQEIVEYPAEAAALFDVLKPVPSERSRTKTVETDESGTEFVVDVEPKTQTKTSAKKNGEVDAK